MALTMSLCKKKKNRINSTASIIAGALFGKEFLFTTNLYSIIEQRANLHSYTLWPHQIFISLFIDLDDSCSCPQEEKKTA